MLNTPRPSFTYLSRRFRTGLGALSAVMVVILGLVGGEAFAYWSGSGHGSGQATVANGNVAITIATNATAGSSLQPGGTGDLVVTVTNPNPAAVTVSNITLGTIGGCTTPAITLTNPSLSFSIPAHASNQRTVLSGALTMGTNSSSDCQGVTFTIPIASETVHQ